MNPPAYVGFGMLTPVAILVVDELPDRNTGSLIREISEFVFDDAAIVACLLRQWGVTSAIIGTAVGNDPRGRALAKQLREWDVQGEVRLSEDIRTPLEVDISDLTGARTYFWKRDAHVLATLADADLSLLKGASILYVDWYDGDYIIRAMEEAARLHIPVFLNFEHAHADAAFLARYAGRANICQAVTKAAQIEGHDPMAVAEKLSGSGVETALITLAGEATLVLNKNDVIRIHAPQISVLNVSAP